MIRSGMPRMINNSNPGTSDRFIQSLNKGLIDIVFEKIPEIIKSSNEQNQQKNDQDDHINDPFQNDRSKNLSTGIFSAFDMDPQRVISPNLGNAKFAR